MKKLKLFFSWQSDVNGNHEKIRDALILACKTILQEGEYNIQYTESTWERSGSPIIDKVVMEKAKDCDMFVADLTPVAYTQNKSLPNPNVMLELGVAKASMMDDVILLLYSGDIDTNRMPFDINHQRLSRFSKTKITDYVRLMAQTAVENPKHRSAFDDNDKFLFYNRNVRKNIASGKYLPNVFLEDRKIKQHLRDFVDPYTFCKLVLERCDMFELYRLNRNRKITHRAPFTFDISPYKTCAAEESIGTLYQGVEAFQKYLRLKYDELHTNNSRDYFSSSKFGKQYEHLRYVSGKLLLITTSAGQGKTNLVCDLVERVLLTRHIPFVYLNGYEIKPDDIGKSFADMMLPGTNTSFENAIKEVATYCKYKRCPIIFIIDGLNENPLPDVFASNLEVFLDMVLQYDCVKVLMTCRTEYYQERFVSLDVAFKDKMIKIEELNEHFRDEEKQKLLHNYLTYYNIKANISNYVEDALCKDLLLLRIFSEANQGKTLGHVHSIKREELFAEYYELMTLRLIEKVQNELHYRLEKSSISSFMENMVNYMISNDSFFNVPLPQLLKNIAIEEEEIFKRFLDENILLRKDLAPAAKGAFSHNEVVNFTYDSFRDYIISAYLSDSILPRNFSEYERSVRIFTSSGHQLREGITPFLFVHSKNNQQRNACNVLSQLDWYEDVFEGYIWDVKEESIEDADIKTVQNLLSKESPKHVACQLVYWGRWNTEKHGRLNIRLLLDHLSTLDDKALSEFMEKIWSQEIKKYYGRQNEKSERWHMINSLEKLMEDNEIIQYKDIQNLYELLLYMCGCSERYAQDVYIQYLRKFGNAQQMEAVQKVTQSYKLVVLIEQLKSVL